MGDVQFRFRDDEPVSDPGVTVDAFGAQTNAAAVRLEPGDDARELLPYLERLKLKISGCINACGHHHAGHIGILGVDRKGTENYQLLLGGCEGDDTSLGTITGPGFSEDGIVDAIETATEVYLANKQGEERFLDTYRRLGMAPFKEAIYG